MDEVILQKALDLLKASGFQAPCAVCRAGEDSDGQLIAHWESPNLWATLEVETEDKVEFFAYDRKKDESIQLVVSIENLPELAGKYLQKTEGQEYV